MIGDRQRRADDTPDLKAQEQFYDGFWAGRSDVPNPWELQRLAKILEALGALVQPSRNSLEICDLGCGTGWISSELARVGSVTGVDLSPEGIKIARERWPGIEFEVADILSYRPEKSFDLVVSSEVIEHVEDKAGYFETVDRILKPQGFLILTTPNGDVWKRWPHHRQLLELWPTRRELMSLVKTRMEVLRYETFVFNYSNAGVMRILNSQKLNGVLRDVGLGPVYRGIRGALGNGLFQALTARKPA